MKKAAIFLSMLLVLLLSSSAAQASTVKVQNQVKELEPLEVHYIDVGQGDATLIKCGDEAMLLDAGDTDKGTLVQNYLKNQKVKELSYLIVTHPDADHCGGADVIVTKYDIDTIIMPNYEKDTAAYRDLIESMDYRRYKTTEPKVGDTYTLGDATFTIIAPNKEDYGDVINNYSVGILLEHGDKKFLFTGDAEEQAETDILKNGISIRADVLKAGHHGSKTSTAEDFVKAVAPKYAVISCEEGNEYALPHAAVLNTLRANKVEVFRTDEQGSLIAYSDGKNIKWNAAPSTTWQVGEAQKPKSGAESSTKQKTEQKVEQKAEQPKQEAVSDASYVLNVKTMKFHLPSCGSLPTTNRKDTTDSRDTILQQGYVPCKKCNP